MYTQVYNSNVSRVAHRSQLGPLADLGGPGIPLSMAAATYSIQNIVFQNILYAIHTFYHNVTTPEDSYSMFQYQDLDPCPEEIMCTL